MTGDRRSRRAVAVLGVLAALLAGAAPAGADPARVGGPVGPSDPVPGGFGSWEALAKAQERMNRAADRISAAGRAEESGYAGIVAAPENGELRVHWKGRPSAATARLLAELHADVRITVLPARFSERELWRETERLRQKGTVTSVAPRADGGGLTVTLAHGAVATLDAGEVPVEVTTGFSPAATSRWNDQSPWWGGGVTLNDTIGEGCTTGFAVAHQGRTKILTAGHCGRIGDRMIDPTGQHIGYVSQRNAAREALLIDARAEGRVYNNGLPGQEWWNPVIGAVGSYVGNWVCTSGAFSGTRCGIKVMRTGVQAYFADINQWVGPVVVAEKADRTSASGNGDSGGPVLQPAADPTRTYAAGIISGGDLETAVPCTGYVPTGRTCSWRMIYVDIATATSAVGASLVLG